MTIPVIFDGFEFPNVKSVTPKTELDPTQIIDTSSLAAKPTREFVVAGYVKGGDRSRTGAAAAQKALIDALEAKGPGTIEYPGVTPYTARVTEIEWTEWTGNPVIFYEVTLETDTSTLATGNPFTSAIVLSQTKVGGVAKTFDPTPALTDVFKAINFDNTPSSIYDKEFTLAGTLRGTKAEVDAEISTPTTGLKALLTEDVVYSLSINSGVYAVKIADFSIDTPATLDAGASVNYEINLITLPDFTLEERALQGGSFTIAGITVGVASSFSHNITRNNKGDVTAETISVSGKNQFTSPSLAEAFKAAVDGRVLSPGTYVSSTGKTLAVTSVSWSEVQRDGHFPTGEKRYSLGFSLSLGIDPTSETGGPGSLSGTVLGIFFDVLNSVTFSASFDSEGAVASRTKSGSGLVVTTPTTRPGDQVSEDGRTFFITSLNLGDLDESDRRSVSVSGTTLDTALSAELLMSCILNGFFLDHCQTQGRSVNYQFDEEEGAFRATSINFNVSGFRIGNDGNVINLIRTVNRLKNQFIFTNVSVSAPEKVRRAGVIQLRYNISLSGVINLIDGSFDNERAADVEFELDRTIEFTRVKFAQITIPGKGVVFKKIGFEPATETVTVRNIAKNRRIFRTMPFPTAPATQIDGGQEIRNRINESGLTKSRTVVYQSFDEVIN